MKEFQVFIAFKYFSGLIWSSHYKNSVIPYEEYLKMVYVPHPDLWSIKDEKTIQNEQKVLKS